MSKALAVFNSYAPAIEATSEEFEENRAKRIGGILDTTIARRRAGN